MSTNVRGLGHIGFYVQDLDLMKDFYAKFMGMTLTKVGPIGAFFSSDPFVETACTWLSDGFCGTTPSSFIYASAYP